MSPRVTGDDARSATGWRPTPGSQPSAQEVERSRVTVPAVDNGRSQSTAADGIHEADRCAANRDRTDGEPANRHPKTESGSAEREHETDRCAAKRHETAGEPPDRHHADRHVPYGDDPLRHPGSHRDWVHSCANVNERPAADRYSNPTTRRSSAHVLHTRRG